RKVREFNARMAAAGSSWAFYDHATPAWAPPGAAPDVGRNFYLALDDAGAVRAGYVLKTEPFLLRGKPFAVASIQGPVSEGLVDPAYGALAFHLIRDMEDRSPGLFSWGASDRLDGLLARLGFSQFSMPFQLRILRAGRFLRRNAFLRKSA